MTGDTSISNQRFVEASRSDLLHYVQRRIADHDEAQAIVQDAYLNFFRAGYDAAGDDARPLLFTIAKNLLNDHYHRQQKQDRIIAGNAAADTGQAPDPAETVHASRQLNKIIAAIEAMPPKRQEVFKLSRFEGLKNTEIATQLGISKSMVEKHLAEALKDLRRAT